MSLCALTERAWRDNLAHARAHRADPSGVLAVCDWEQDWRSRGEPAIREEMERRITAWNLSHLPRLPRPKNAA
jgi:hypothetical protein